MQGRTLTEEECGFVENVMLRLMDNGVFQDCSLRQKFRPIFNYEKRVQYALAIIKRNSAVLPKFMPNAKTSESSTKYRNQGNEIYRNNDVLTGIAFYNMALLHAPPESMDLAYAYGNRSAAFFEIKEYGNCLKDISRALAISDDPELNRKLLQRKATCDEIYQPVAVNDDAADKIRREMFSPPSRINSRVPCFSADIRMSRNSKYGRCVLANTNLDPGKVLAVENTPMISLLKEYYQRKCFGCFMNNDVMIPCPGCNYVMFCDEECFKKSWDRMHKIDCPMMQFFWGDGLPNSFGFAFRSMLGARCDEDSWEEFLVAVKAENKRFPKLSDIKDCQPKSKKYTYLYTLETNERLLDSDDMFMRSIYSAIFLYYLEKHTRFFTKFSKTTNMDESPELERPLKKKYMRFAGGIILQYLMVSDFNSFGIAGREDMNNTEVARQNFASALYPFSSAFNHSCAANARWVFDKTTLIIKCVRPIKKGEQIFLSYGQEYADVPVSVRQRELRTGYKFTCDCPACIQRWPTRCTLPMVNHVLIKSNQPTLEMVSPNFYAEVKKENLEYLSNVIVNLCKLSTVMEQFLPSVELVETQKRIKICWEMFRDSRFF